MNGIGKHLRMARTRMGFTLQEVEQFSARLAEKWGDPKYRISSSWLDRVELQNRTLSAVKLTVLSLIYNLTPEHMLMLRPNAKVGSEKEEADDLEIIAQPNSTILIPDGPLAEHARRWIPDTLVTSRPPELTTTLPHARSALPTHYKRAIVGRKDKAMEPMILPGAILLIDTSRRTIAHRRDWHNEFDRPIYFLFTRSGFCCGFCELDKKEDWLSLVPHMLSSERKEERWRYRKDVEVIGTVTHVSSKRVA